jgi:hypothetical protein
VGADVAGVGVDGRCRWALSWQVSMGTGGRRWSLGGGDDVAPLGGFVRGVGGRQRDRRAPWLSPSVGADQGLDGGDDRTWWW